MIYYFMPDNNKTELKAIFALKNVGRTILEFPSFTWRSHLISKEHNQIMEDTTPKIIERFNKMMMKLGAEKRLKMGFSMNQTSRKIVVASLLDRKPQATPSEKRLVLFNRFYQKEFDQKTCEKILKNLLQEK